MAAIVVVATCVLTGCVTPPPPKPLTPVVVIVVKPPAAVVAIAGRELDSAGFIVDRSDADVGKVAGSRLRARTANADLTTCRTPKLTRSDSNAETVIVVSVGTKPAGGGSEVTIGANVETRYAPPPGSSSAVTVSTVDCVSNGTMERRIADAVRAP